jgi:hypothetical protein
MAQPASAPSSAIPLGGSNIDVSSVAFDAPTAPGFIRGFYVTVQGAVKVDFADGAPSGYQTAFIYPVCVPGVEYRGRIKKIYAAADGTTATGIAVLI